LLLEKRNTNLTSKNTLQTSCRQNLYRYNGKEKDEHTGLYEYGQRYYAPWLCRFVSVDPIAEDYPFYSSYNYAGNKPISKRDLEGLQESGDVAQKMESKPASIDLPEITPELASPTIQTVTNTTDSGQRTEDRIRNGTLVMVEHSQKQVDDAGSDYKKLVSNHEGDYKNKHRKKYERKSGLKSAKIELAYWTKKAQMVDQMISTFKTVSPEKYDELLSMIPENMSVVVTYNRGMVGPGGSTNPMGTSIPAKQLDIQNADGETRSTWSGEFSSNEININIYGGSSISPLQTRFLANEFGDIDYFFKNVKPNDAASFKKWRTTGSSAYSGYRTDPTGAGQMSFNYQYEFEEAFKKAVESLPKERVNLDNWIIY